MTKLTSMVVFCVAVASQHALAATVTFQIQHRLTTTAEAEHDPDAANKRVYEFRVTTSSDILRIGDVVLSSRAGLYNSPIGTDTEPPNPLFVPVFPSLSADSWITTPGLTALAGAGGTTADNNSWFDTTNDGPQSNFLFARITWSAKFGDRISGVVSVLGDSGDPEVHPLRFEIVPEPMASALTALSLLGLAPFRRRRPWVVVLREQRT